MKRRKHKVVEKPVLRVAPPWWHPLSLLRGGTPVPVAPKEAPPFVKPRTVDELTPKQREIMDSFMVFGRFSQLRYTREGRAECLRLVAWGFLKREPNAPRSSFGAPETWGRMNFSLAT